MTLKELQYHFHNQLDAIYGKQEVASFFRLLMEHYLNIKPIELTLHPKLNLSNADQNQFTEAINRLKKEEPIQYIIGETEFFGLAFKVNGYTLIPRPETEELVQWIITEQPTTNTKLPKILDIGTGSGCIAISLAKKLPNAKVYALDVSSEALKVTKDNADLNDVEVECIEADILNLKTKDRSLTYPNLEFSDLKFDFIVSNPPYVRELEKTTIKNNVLQHEPHLALFVKNEDPLLFYKAICEFAVHNLKPNGILFFEINQYLGAEMKDLLKAFNFESVELRQDLFGNDRMLKAIKP